MLVSLNALSHSVIASLGVRAGIDLKSTYEWAVAVHKEPPVDYVPNKHNTKLLPICVGYLRYVWGWQREIPALFMLCALRKQTVGGQGHAKSNRSLRIYTKTQVHKIKITQVDFTCLLKTFKALTRVGHSEVEKLIIIHCLYGLRDTFPFWTCALWPMQV